MGTLTGDIDLLKATRRGQAEAFGELFARHRALVLAYLTRRASAAEPAADLLAETFASALLADARRAHTGRARPRRRGC